MYYHKGFISVGNESKRATAEESGHVSCELHEKCKKVNKLNANKTQKLNWLISNKRKDVKTERKFDFNSQNRCNDLN